MKTDLIVPDDFGDTPLHLAARKGQLQCVVNMRTSLTKETENIRIENIDGDTAYDVAKSLDHQKMFPYLEPLSNHIK